jgi:hypothetical protein
MRSTRRRSEPKHLLLQVRVHRHESAEHLRPSVQQPSPQATSVEGSGRKGDTDGP